MQFKFTPPQINSMTAKFAWTAHYAVDVWVDRPWTDVALAQNDITQMIAEGSTNGGVEQGFTSMVDRMTDEFTGVIDDHSWGIDSQNRKQYRDLPTWDTITDSGALADSLEVTTSVA